jgi:hypothetical protein
MYVLYVGIRLLPSIWIGLSRMTMNADLKVLFSHLLFPTNVDDMTILCSSKISMGWTRQWPREGRCHIFHAQNLTPPTSFGCIEILSSSSRFPGFEPTIPPVCRKDAWQSYWGHFYAECIYSTQRPGTTFTSYSDLGSSNRFEEKKCLYCIHTIKFGVL